MPAMGTGMACLSMMAVFHGLSMDPKRLAHEMALGSTELTTRDLVLAARKVGFHAKLHKPQLSRLHLLGLPCIVLDKWGQYFLLGAVRQEQGEQSYLIQRPGVQAPEVLLKAQFEETWAGEVTLLTSKASLVGELAKFDFSWFIPAIIKYRKQLLEVLMVSLVLQLFALATPLFFQVIMDKVLLHRVTTTLNVITIALLVVSLFDVVLNLLRTYLFAHTSYRIDVELGARLYRHLLSLPLSYFDARRVGDSVARVKALEQIREFLTGNGITLVLDLVFSVVFIAVMFFYSAPLAWVVVGSIPCYFAVSLLATPLLRRQLDEKFNRGAENQSFLVESVSSVHTIKSMALEPRWIKSWDQQLAQYVRASLQANRTGIVAQNLVSLIGKLVMILITWLGASLVMEGSMTLGQLVAFNMLSGHVSQPVMRLAQMWADFQQVGISMARLGDILNTRTEVFESNTALPALKGRVELDGVTFRYQPGASEAMRNVSMVIQPGETVAIVGRSGSGKSTTTKLIQRLYHPEAGRILIDGFDLALIDPASLRRQIGVVLQENTLFNRSVRDNIAVSDPSATMERVVYVAEMSGAHEFIRELPQGYDTVLGENGTGLSGGQRQRIAIARALLSDPRILILDEATSALDYESERIVQANMEKIRANRTVIIVAHRLSAIRSAERIYVMERGQIIESGTHQELMEHADGFYHHLVRMQQM
ncbi:type I secretion system permease/ATPase [Limnohabitans sp. 2KL-17]|nr:type I secretion system permease/ATPase [Limnohabitans sp. 2KL-17]